jgi:hypothetical protein
MIHPITVYTRWRTAMAALDALPPKRFKAEVMASWREDEESIADLGNRTDDDIVAEIREIGEDLSDRTLAVAINAAITAQGLRVTA